MLNNLTSLATLTPIISYDGERRIEIIQDIWTQIFSLLMTREKKLMQLVAKGFRLTMKNFLESSNSNSYLLNLGFEKFGKAINYAHSLNLNIVNLSYIQSIDEKHKSLSKLTSAHKLLLGSTNVDNNAMKSIASLTRLKTLDLNRTIITHESAPFIGSLTNLEALALAHSTFCEKGIIMIAQRLTLLQDLQLPSSGSFEVFNAIAGLSNLKSLAFTNEISESALEVLSANHLQKLEWRENELNDERLESLSKNLINLRHLNLSKSTFKALPILEAPPTNITDKGVIALAKNCTNLVSINISYCRVGDAGVKALAENCRALQYADISDCRIGNASITALAENCLYLNTIVISNTDVGEEGIQDLLKRQLPLKKIFAFDCKNISSDYQKLIKETFANTDLFYF